MIFRIAAGGRLNPYEVLGVAPDAPHDEIKRAWRRLAREAHPDRNPGDPQAGERFKRIAEAWQIVGDPVRRRAFDLRAGRAARGEIPEEWVEHVANAIERAQTWIEETVLPHALAGWRGRGAEAIARLVADLERWTTPTAPAHPPPRAARRRAARVAGRVHVTVDLAPAADLATTRRTRDGRFFVVVTPWALWARGVRDPVAIDDLVMRLLLPRYAFAVADGRVATTDPAEGRRLDDAHVLRSRLRAALWTVVALLMAFMIVSGWLGL